MAGRGEREVRLTILGEDKGAAKALKQVDDAAARLGPSGKVAENALDSVTSKLTSGLGPASGQAKEALDKIGGSAVASGGMLTAALAGGAIVAGAALVKFAFDGVNAMVGLAGEVRNFQRASGLGAEDASRMVSVLDDLGISSDVGASAMFKLAKNVSDGGEKLGLYGIEVGRTKDGNIDLITTLASVADAYTKTNDPARKAEIAFAAFGKQGQALIPILERGSAGLTEMFDAVKRGEILSQKQIDDTRKFELAVDDLQDSFRSLQIQAGEALLPFLITLANAGTNTLDFIDRMKDRLGGVGDAIGKVVSHAGPLGFAYTAVKALGMGTDEAGEAAAGAAAKFDLEVASLEALGIEVSDTERATGQLTEETKKAAAEAEKYRQKIDTMATGIQAAYKATGRGADMLTEEHRQMARGMDTAKLSADQLKQGMDALIGVHLAAWQAAISWEAAIDSATTTLGENKQTLDISTEAGRENERVLQGMITAALSHIDALQREGHSAEAVTAAYHDHVAALRNVMTQAGYTDAQINELLHRYNLLAAAPDINKRITTTWVTVGERTYGGEIGGRNAPGIQLAKGGIVEGPTMALIGEAGRELVLPLTDMSRTAQLLDQAGLLSPLGAASGSVAGTGGDTYIIAPQVGTLVGSDGMHELTEMIQAALLRKQRRVPSLGLS